MVWYTGITDSDVESGIKPGGYTEVKDTDAKSGGKPGQNTGSQIQIREPSKVGRQESRIWIRSQEVHPGIPDSLPATRDSRLACNFSPSAHPNRETARVPFFTTCVGPGSYVLFVPPPPLMETLIVWTDKAYRVRCLTTAYKRSDWLDIQYVFSNLAYSVTTQLEFNNVGS